MLGFLKFGKKLGFVVGFEDKLIWSLRNWEKDKDWFRLHILIITHPLHALHTEI